MEERNALAPSSPKWPRGAEVSSIVEARNPSAAPSLDMGTETATDLHMGAFSVLLWGHRNY